jgi:hypothetical protein
LIKIKWRKTVKQKIECTLIKIINEYVTEDKEDLFKYQSEFLSVISKYSAEEIQYAIEQIDKPLKSLEVVRGWLCENLQRLSKELTKL